MEAIYKFDLPEDQNDLTVFMHAYDWALTVWDMDNKLRNWLKYGHDFKTADESLESVRDELHKILEERSITLDMIT